MVFELRNMASSISSDAGFPSYEFVTMSAGDIAAGDAGSGAATPLPFKTGISVVGQQPPGFLSFDVEILGLQTDWERSLGETCTSLVFDGSSAVEADCNCLRMTALYCAMDGSFGGARLN